MDIKENLAQNITRYRKALNLTQAELAVKLNYSDKAVSKWERGESVPDLVVLKQLADFYGTTIDNLLKEPKVAPKPVSIKNISKKRFLLCLLSTCVVWLIATLFFVFSGVIFPTLIHTWLAFIYATPLTFMILLILTSVWGKSVWNAVSASLLNWTFITAVYLTLFYALRNPPHTLWMIFLIGIPLQLLIILVFSYKKIK